MNISKLIEFHKKMQFSKKDEQYGGKGIPANVKKGFSMINDFMNKN